MRWRAWPPPGARAQQTFTGSAEIVPQQVDRMYVKGLDYLVRTQTPAGNWSDADQGPSAIAGLAVVSLLAHGDDPNSAPTPKPFIAAWIFF